MHDRAWQAHGMTDSKHLKNMLNFPPRKNNRYDTKSYVDDSHEWRWKTSNARRPHYYFTRRATRNNRHDDGRQRPTPSPPTRRQSPWHCRRHNAIAMAHLTINMCPIDQCRRPSWGQNEPFSRRNDLYFSRRISTGITYMQSIGYLCRVNCRRGSPSAKFLGRIWPAEKSGRGNEVDGIDWIPYLILKF